MTESWADLSHLWRVWQCFGALDRAGACCRRTWSSPSSCSSTHCPVITQRQAEEKRRLEPAETLSELGLQRTRIPEGRSSRRSRRSWTAGDPVACRRLFSLGCVPHTRCLLSNCCRQRDQRALCNAGGSDDAADAQVAAAVRAPGRPPALARQGHAARLAGRGRKLQRGGNDQRLRQSLAPADLPVSLALFVL